MTWNYRVIRRRFPKENQYTIHEVFYNDATGKPDGMTEDEVSPSGESLDEFRKSMEMYQRAIELPVLDYETLEEVKNAN